LFLVQCLVQDCFYAVAKVFFFFFLAQVCILAGYYAVAKAWLLFFSTVLCGCYGVAMLFLCSIIF